MLRGERVPVGSGEEGSSELVVLVEVGSGSSVVSLGSSVVSVGSSVVSLVVSVGERVVVTVVASFSATTKVTVRP